MDAIVKQEIFETVEFPAERPSGNVSKPVSVIELSSSDSYSSDSDDSDDDSTVGPYGKRFRVSNGDGECFKKHKLGVVLPLGFLDPLPPEDEALPLPQPIPQSQSGALVQGCKQFWKAGDYEGVPGDGSGSTVGGMDHVRVHPKFLHSNATSHKWALGAFAELLDNSLDEVCNGATYVNVDVLKNTKDGSKMLLVEDNGGGMDPDKVRQCMSLGYSVKSKIANTIGQYGNGFKTSTMRLGADVIVFSRCHGKDGKSPTQSIGMLSYTFLRTTGKEDIVVPMLDYEKGGRDWTKMTRLSPCDWNKNLETIVQWSPYSSEADLFNQFNLMKDQGTRVIIYNLWEDDQGELELDFDTNQHDIQMRGVNRDEKKIEMAKHFPNSKHFLTYRHSLRSYASILYLRLPPGFRIILRGKDVEHHNIVNDMMLRQEVTYRPQLVDGPPKDSNMIAVVKIGFVKDAKDHIDVQGFNVYHKNRLIKPFWRVWNAAGSDGRGVIGVLEANFVEPAHDKQGFERTTVLSRLETRLKEIQKDYWSNKCHEVGYAPRRNKRLLNESAARETSPDYLPQSSSRHTQSKGTPHADSNKSHSNHKLVGSKEPERSFKAVGPRLVNGDTHRKAEKVTKISTKYGKQSSSPEASPAEGSSSHVMEITPLERVIHGSSNKASSAQKSFLKDGHERLTTPLGGVIHGSSNKAASAQKSPLKDGSHTTQSLSSYSENHDNEGDHTPSRERDRISTRSQSKVPDAAFNGNGHASAFSACSLNQLREENRTLNGRLKEMEQDLQFERDRCKSLEAQVKEVEQKFEEANREQDALVEIFSEERSRREDEEKKLRDKLKAAATTIQELLDRVVSLEKTRCPSCSKP
ncbi:protein MICRORCHIDIA 7 isoform X2 [Telopea speciosissima]|uniref:protein MICRORCHIDIA 7 isoform X2 n=1 Tax=Telopea speciosissima TaxID=54955 RepID=UPI001CC49E30|nr:protein MICRORCHIDIA 7 isoform X2 [Telopea speciosissima]